MFEETMFGQTVFGQTILVWTTSAQIRAYPEVLRLSTKQ
jgi:hypothetical protein